MQTAYGAVDRLQLRFRFGERFRDRNRAWMQSAVDKQYGNFTECAKIKGEAKANLKWQEASVGEGGGGGSGVDSCSRQRGTLNA